MRVLVTGAAGFVGSHLVSRLVADGDEVVGVDSMTDYYDVGLKRANLERNASPSFEHHDVDLNDPSIGRLLDGVDSVVHLAGQPGVRLSWGTDFSAYVERNVSATQNLLEACSGRDSLTSFVYASSSSVYGDAETFPTPESALPAPRSPYGVTKLAAELLCGVYAASFGVPTVSLRYFTVFGPRQRPDMAFTRFCHAAANGSPIEIYGDGEQVRDFTYVEDVVAANVAAVRNLVTPGSVYNVAGGTSVSVNEVLAALSEIAGKSLDVRYSGAVAGDARRTGGDTTRIAEAYGWRPEVDLLSGLSAQLAWARSL